MSKKDFIGELLEYGVGFAMTFLIFLGLAAAMIVFLTLVALVAFLERILN
jgi:hypothetical protein